MRLECHCGHDGPGKESEARGVFVIPGIGPAKEFGERLDADSADQDKAPRANRTHRSSRSRALGSKEHFQSYVLAVGTPCRRWEVKESMEKGKALLLSLFSPRIVYPHPQLLGLGTRAKLLCRENTSGPRG